MEQKKFREGRELNRGDIARISASTVNAILEKLDIEKLDIRQIVEGIAVLPAGEGVYLVDIVMRDLARDSTWSISITVPPPKADTKEQEPLF